MRPTSSGSRKTAISAHAAQFGWDYAQRRGFVAASYAFGSPAQDRFRIPLLGRNLSDKESIGSFTNSMVDLFANSVGRT